MKRVKLLVAFHLSVIACETENQPGPSEPYTIVAAGLIESSGLAASKRFENVLWTHNDDGPSLLFAIKPDGQGIRSFELPGVRNNDWEDVAVDQQGYLYVLDNTSRQDEQHRSLIYILEEPDPFLDEEVGPVRTLEVRFLDGGHDTETIFVWEDHIYLVTKPWDGTRPRIYSVRNQGTRAVADFLGYLAPAAMITGGDISSDGRLIALSSYRALFIFEGETTPGEMLQSKPLVCQLNAGQVEGITWSGRNLLLSNEPSALYFVPEANWRDEEAPFQELRSAQIPYVSTAPSDDDALVDWERGAWLDAEVNGQAERIGRLAWSSQGLHVGVQLPDQLAVGLIGETRFEDPGDWFVPGRVYLLINPAGDRQLSYGVDDRCIVIGADSTGEITWEARYLRPATWIEFSESRPGWVTVKQQQRKLLVTVTRQAPGMNRIRRGSELGFNLLIVDAAGKIISWSPLTLEYSWDAPSVWGLLELID